MNPTCPPPSGGSPDSQRGMALMVALFAIVMMMTFVTDLIVSSSVAIHQTLAGSERIKSKYLAKSGANLGIYLVSSSLLVKKAVRSGLVPQGVLSAADTPQSLWAMANSWPPFGRETVEFLRKSRQESTAPVDDPFQAGGLMGEKLASQMILFEDAFSIRIEDESAKIQLSSCADRSSSPCLDTTAQLIALFSGPVEEQFLTSQGTEPKEMAYRIIDFISAHPDVHPESNLNSKHAPYEAADPPYRARAGYLDTVADLRLVHGWTAQLHEVFSPYLTVYPYVAPQPRDAQSLINLNTAPSELMLALFSDLRKDRAKLNQAVLDAHQRDQDGSALATETNGIAAVLKAKYGYQPESKNVPTPLRKASWFKTDSEVYRITVTALTGGQERSLQLVIRQIDSQSPLIDSFDNRSQMKRSYRLLYWRLS